MSLDHACQAGQHRHTERGFDLYETPPIAVEALLAASRVCRIGSGNRVRGVVPLPTCCVIAAMPSSAAT